MTNPTSDQPFTNDAGDDMAAITNATGGLAAALTVDTIRPALVAGALALSAAPDEDVVTALVLLEASELADLEREADRLARLCRSLRDPSEPPFG
jgi:hypothetical protein